MNNKIKSIFAIFAVVSVTFFSGCGTTPQQAYTVDLEIWGLFDESTVFAETINQYKTLNPYVGVIKYRKLSQETYKQEIVDALASGQGPDIFLINNTWVPSFENKIEAAPAALVSEREMAANFPDGVLADFVFGGKVYGAPLSMDSLQLYYNKDIFNVAGITVPPRTWDEFNATVQKITKIDENGNITRSGAAIGTGRNVNRAADILTTLMLQNGVALPTKKGVQVKFEDGATGADGNFAFVGENALKQYTQYALLRSFADGNSNPSYTWNVRSHYSVDAFAEGSTAMMFNYSWQINSIASKNPKLNFGVAPMPQLNLSKPVTTSNYWGYVVSRNKLTPVAAQADQVAAPVPNEVRVHEAWQFLKFLTLKNSGTVKLTNAYTKNAKDFPVNFDPAIEYLKKTKQPGARRDIIEIQKNDPWLNPFVVGNLTAKNWFQVDADMVDKLFVEMIDDVNVGKYTLRDALTMASNRVNSFSK